MPSTHVSEEFISGGLSCDTLTHTHIDTYIHTTVNSAAYAHVSVLVTASDNQ